MPRNATLVLPEIDTCRWRVRQGDSACCSLIGSLLGTEAATVADDVCLACCQSFPPTARHPNPVVASLLYQSACRILGAGGSETCTAERAFEVKHLAERSLTIIHPTERTLTPARTKDACCWLGAPLTLESVTPQRRSEPTISGLNDSVLETQFGCAHANHVQTTKWHCRICPDWSKSVPVSRPLSLDEMIPPPVRRTEARVNQWAVAVTTAPRRDPTLEACLDALVGAGWPEPRLFLDGTTRLPARYAHLSVTWREDRVGAWPAWYLALTELVLHHPHADAYVMLQDDAVLFQRGSLRQYLERTLWPGERPGIVSLFYTGHDPDTGWFDAQGAWHFSAQALILAPGVARAFLTDPEITRTLLASSSETHIPIPEIVHGWANFREINVWYPNPSLAQHIGNTSTIWMNAGIENGRRAPWFSGNVETEFGSNERLDEFPEDAFLCDERLREDYIGRVERGKRRMRESSVVICGLCRDVRLYLPRTAARIERLGAMFENYRVVLFENDSVDATCEFLADWKSQNHRVDFMSERAGVMRYPQTRSLDRARWLAECRNRYRERIVQQHPDYDYVIVVDTDLAGGWSYDGIAHSFGDEDWDFVGSYGLQRRMNLEPTQSPFLHFDIWAFHPAPGTAAKTLVNYNELTLRRGESLLPVESCFGGLGIYRMECMAAAEYGGTDCEHVVLHERLRRAGFHRQYLNPSQIVLYSPS